MESEESPKKKFICLHCGHIFESEKEAPHCPMCRRKRVIPLDVFKVSVEKHRDVLEKEGILPKVEPDITKETTDTTEVTAGNDASPEVTVTSTEVPAEVTGNITGNADVTVTPESHLLLSKYLSDLDNVDDASNVSDVDNVEPEPAVKPKRKVRRIKKPSGFSVPVKALAIIGIMVLFYWWWTSRHSTSHSNSVSTSSDAGRLRYGSTYEMINRNIGYNAIG